MQGSRGMVIWPAVWLTVWYPWSAASAATASGSGSPRVDRALVSAVATVIAAEGSTKEAGLRQDLKAARELILQARILAASGNQPDLVADIARARALLSSVVDRCGTQAPSLRAKVQEAANRLHRAEHDINPFTVPAQRIDGRGAGELVLGSSRLGDVERLFTRSSSYEKSPVRRISEKYSAGGVTLDLRYVYRPPESGYDLYFDRAKRLILIVDGTAYGSLTLAQWKARYPRFARSRTGPDWEEWQGNVNECTTLVVLSARGNERTDSAGYACTCPLLTR